MQDKHHKRIAAALLAAACSLLSGCGPGPMADREIEDKGAVDIAAYPGYKLRALRVDLGVGRAPHHLYILEKDGEPVSGASPASNKEKYFMALTGAAEAQPLRCERTGTCREILQRLQEQEDAARRQ